MFHRKQKLLKNTTSFLEAKKGLILRVSLLLALFFFLSQTLTYAAAPRTTTFTGKITGLSGKLKVIIANASIQIKDSTGVVLGSGKSDYNGIYKVSCKLSRSLPLKISAEAVKYVTQVRSCISSPGRTYTINFTLSLSPLDRDRIAPTGTITINNKSEYTNSTEVNLTLTAEDNAGGSGLSQMRLSSNGISWKASEGFSSSKAWTLDSGDGEKSVYVKYCDNVGNWSKAYSAKIILDTKAPEIVISSPVDGAIVDTPTVKLEGTVDGVAFSEDRTLIDDGKTLNENIIAKTATDQAGNSSSASVKVYLYTGQLIGPEGGEVTSPDGKVKVVIPSGALSAAKQIKVLGIDNSSMKGAAPSGSTLLSVAECKPYGLVFNKPIEIIYTLYQAEVPGTSIELGFYDAVQGKIIETGQKAVVPADGYTVTFSLNHFSTYAALKDLAAQSTPIGVGVKVPVPDLLTGAFSHGIPITGPPGRKGMQPSLSLNYRSSSPNSWIGLGYSLNPGYIVRSTRLGPPSYIDTQDTFYLITDAGTTELVWLVDNLYQAKVESSFTKFFKESDDSWKVVAKDGNVLRFGQAVDSKETSSKGTFSWYLTKAVDTNGNYITYNYTKDEGKCYLSRIDYTGNENGTLPANSVEFSLEARTDVASNYLSSSRIATARRLKEVQAKSAGHLVWRYELSYEYSQDTNRSLLTAFKQSAGDGSSLPVQGFSYNKAK